MKKGVLTFLHKKGFIKEEDRQTVVSNFTEEVLNITKKSYNYKLELVSFNFELFHTYLNKQNQLNK